MSSDKTTPKKKKKSPGRPRITYPPLSKAQLALCPSGDDRCRLCQLRPDQIKELHRQRFKEKLTYKQIRLYIKDKFGMGEDYTRISNHFNRHVSAKAIVQKLLKKDEAKYPELMGALDDISAEVTVATSGQLEKAYEQLVKMAQTFVDKTNKIQTKIAIEVDCRDLKEEIEDIPVMELLEKQAKLNKEAREFIKEVTMLRAPKVMVAQFLESFIDSVIKDMGYLLSNMAGELKHDISAELSDAGHAGLLSETTFADTFKRMALDYRDRMVNMKRQKMADALSALQDLEKLL
jgi:hypothetical protein